MILRGARVRSLRPPVAALSGHGRAKLDLGARLWLVRTNPISQTNDAASPKRASYTPALCSV